MVFPNLALPEYVWFMFATIVPGYFSLLLFNEHGLIQIQKKTDFDKIMLSFVFLQKTHLSFLVVSFYNLNYF